MTDWISGSIAAGAGDRVRAGVMGRIRRRRLVRRSLAAAAAALVVAMLSWPRLPEAEVLALQAPAAPAAPAVQFTPPAPVQQRPKPAVLAKAGPAADKITIYTSDPDVVIVLVSDGGGE